MSSSTPRVSPFSQAVVKAVQRLYPESLADKSFDNTGLLLEAPYRPGLKNTALLTIDLTKAVADEAIARRDSIIVTYHPIIFKGLKSITLDNTQQNSLLRLAQEGISVYSPHTAVDAAPAGLNEWLVGVVTRPFDISLVTPITPIEEPPPGFEGAGYGRKVIFKTPQDLKSIVRLVTAGLGKLPGVSVAVPQSIPEGERGNIKISSIGICAGSGGSMLNGLHVDLLLTGELSHHEALAAIEQGKCVITTFHSNTERAFLRQVMKNWLDDELRTMAKEQDAAKLGLEDGFEIAVSQVDRDPFEIVRNGQTIW